MVLFILSVDVTFGQLVGQVPLNPKNIPQFVDPLPHFAGLRIPASDNMVIRYEPTKQVAVSTGTVLAGGIVGAPGSSPDLGKANLWAYSVSNDGGTNFTGPHWPAFTIEAQRNTPVNVKYENNLIDIATGDFLTYANVNLIADQTLHWAAPGGMDMMNMDPYTGPVPVVPHLHGGEVASESDGGPDAWFTPGYTYTGPSWGIDETDQNYVYPNLQEAATLWWHDHALGATRLNVYAGLAGFYFLRGPDEENARLPGWSGDDLVQEMAPPGKTGTFNPNPYLPEIEVVFQDRMFDNTGGLYYPNLPPNPMDHPFWTPEFVGDVITVNGKTWPYLSVAPRKYRFRLLNGSNARFYEIWLQDLVSGALGPQLVQIGTDGGLLDKPVPIVGKLLLSPGERADVVIDFAASAPGQVWTLKNSGNTPYPKGGPPNGSTVGRIMQFVVNGTMVDGPDVDETGGDASLLPASIRPTPMVKLVNFAAGTPVVVPTLTRQLNLNEIM
jgi:FtsP/CotA-like multicopper oxidase with cupredoxin domain